MPAGDHEIKCMACGLNCPIEAEDKMERSLCGERKFSVWPDKNYYFKRAVNDLVFREITCFLPEGMVVVDFSSTIFCIFCMRSGLKNCRRPG